MKEVLSVFPIGIGSLCFAAFLTILTINAVPGPSKTSHRNMELSPTHQRRGRCLPIQSAILSRKAEICLYEFVSLSNDDARSARMPHWCQV